MHRRAIIAATAVVAGCTVVAAGSAGENVTLRGVDWATMRPGTRLRVGSALIELSYPAVPCKKQTRWFTDGDFNRISYERNPHWVRWYAWVREALYRYGLERSPRGVVEALLGGPATPDALVREIGRAADST